MPDTPFPPDFADVPVAEHAALARLWQMATPPPAPAPDAARRDAVWARIEAHRHADTVPPMRLVPLADRAPAAPPRAAHARWSRRAAFALPALVAVGVLTAMWWRQQTVVLTGATTDARHMLADGSTVALADGARLLYTRATPRAVTLDGGEATFEVRHDAGRPFTVTTANARIEVLGTIFTVAASTDTATHVTVAHGRVAVEARTPDASTDRLRGEAARVVLTAREEAQVGGARAAGARVSPAAPIADEAGGPIHADAVALGTLFETLGARYDVTIRVPVAILSRPWTLHLDGTPTLDMALDAITLPNGLRWERAPSGEIVVFER